MPTEEALKDDEVIRLIRIGVEELGLRQVRFTGGEPLLRKSLERIVRATAALTTDRGEAPSTAITTNGLGLAKRASPLAAAGLDRVNVSLDTLDRHTYAALTRRDRLQDVFAGIEAAMAAGLTPVKLNSVLMPGVNDGEIGDLVNFALEMGVQLRFIEQMPLGPAERWERSEMVTAADILLRLEDEFELTALDEPRGAAPAALWQVSDGKRTGKIGIIASVTHPFCAACDRTRLTTDGAIRSCLFSSQREEVSLRDLMRSGASDTTLADAWRRAMWEKKPGHGIAAKGFTQPERLMSEIGG